MYFLLQSMFWRRYCVLGWLVVLLDFRWLCLVEEEVAFFASSSSTSSSTLRYYLADLEASSAVAYIWVGFDGVVLLLEGLAALFDSRCFVVGVRY